VGDLSIQKGSFFPDPAAGSACGRSVSPRLHRWASRRGPDRRTGASAAPSPHPSSLPKEKIVIEIRKKMRSSDRRLDRLAMPPPVLAASAAHRGAPLGGTETKVWPLEPLPPYSLRHSTSGRTLVRMPTGGAPGCAAEAARTGGGVTERSNRRPVLHILFLIFLTLARGVLLASETGCGDGAAVAPVRRSGPRRSAQRCGRGETDRLPASPAVRLGKASFSGWTGPPHLPRRP